MADKSHVMQIEGVQESVEIPSESVVVITVPRLVGAAAAPEIERDTA
jgi:hypothetical protein